MPDNTIQQIEKFHSKWSKMNLADKMTYIMSKQLELNSWANTLANNRHFRGYFIPEEKAVVQQLQDIQKELNSHRAEVNKEIHDEIGKELLKAIINLVKNA
ncbi:MAG: hypothetical protein IJJ73_09295 [Bacteroidaceae bacterium]|nr:hypothetical protein [Bacteroidaceae bacterium]